MFLHVFTRYGIEKIYNVDYTFKIMYTNLFNHIFNFVHYFRYRPQTLGANIDFINIFIFDYFYRVTQSLRPKFQFLIYR